MSAYLMSAADLAAIARAAAKMDGRIDAETVFNVLLDENLKSLGYRYEDAGRIADWCDDGEAAYTWERLEPVEHSAGELDDMVRSYQYQSCEHPEWQDSAARKLTDVLRAWLAPQVQAEKDAEAAKIQARRAALAKLPTLYPKETAAAIRKLLKAQYPSTKFSVKTERGSMVSSVRISWTDGPTKHAVGSLVGSFEAGKFDGMTDSYDYDHDHVLMIDGAQYTPGCRYVFCEREISDTLANRCIAQIVEYWGGIDNPPRALPGPCGFNVSDNRGREPIRKDMDHTHDWYTMIHRAAEDRTRYTRESAA